MKMKSALIILCLTSSTVFAQTSMTRIKTSVNRLLNRTDMETTVAGGAAVRTTNNTNTDAPGNTLMVNNKISYIINSRSNAKINIPYAYTDDRSQLWDSTLGYEVNINTSGPLKTNLEGRVEIPSADNFNIENRISSLTAIPSGILSLDKYETNLTLKSKVLATKYFHYDQISDDGDTNATSRLGTIVQLDYRPMDNYLFSFGVYGQYNFLYDGDTQFENLRPYQEATYYFSKKTLFSLGFSSGQMVDYNNDLNLSNSAGSGWAAMLYTKLSHRF